MTRVRDPGGGTVVNRHTVNTLENPPFDPRGYIKTDPWGKLRRGRIVEAQAAFGTQGIKGVQSGALAQFRRLRFLFNPSEIDVNYSLDAMQSDPPLPPQMDNSHFQWKGSVVGQLTFSLLFDRTYELWDRRLKDNWFYQRGCEADLSMLKQILNIDDFVGAGKQNVMLLNPVYVFFGGTTALAYYGYIDSIGLQYAHFTQNMVPVRAGISVSMGLLITDKTSPVYDPQYVGFADTAATYGNIFDPHNNDQMSVGF